MAAIIEAQVVKSRTADVEVFMDSAEREVPPDDSIIEMQQGDAGPISCQEAVNVSVIVIWNLVAAICHNEEM